MDDLREQIELLESSANLSATIGDFQMPLTCSLQLVTRLPPVCLPIV